MRNVWTIAKREFNQYFASPVAYAVAFALLLILGLFFYIDLTFAAQYGNTPDPSRTTSLFLFLMLFFTPAITMRSMAEEQRTGTLELLLTAPVKEWELITGKWLAAFSFVSLLILATFIYQAILNRSVVPPLDRGPLLANYLGLILACAAMLAIGVCVSSWFNNQIAAFFAITAVLLLAWVIGQPAQNSTGVVAEVLNYLDLRGHFYNNFTQGVIDLSDITYFVSTAVLFLFVGARSIESRRWR